MPTSDRDKSHTPSRAGFTTHSPHQQALLSHSHTQSSFCSLRYKTYNSSAITTFRLRPSDSPRPIPPPHSSPSPKNVRHPSRKDHPDGKQARRKKKQQKTASTPSRPISPSVRRAARGITETTEEHNQEKRARKRKTRHPQGPPRKNTDTKHPRNLVHITNKKARPKKKKELIASPCPSGGPVQSSAIQFHHAICQQPPPAQKHILIA